MGGFDSGAKGLSDKSSVAPQPRDQQPDTETTGPPRHEGRASASAQIHRSLKAWRDRREEEGAADGDGAVRSESAEDREGAAEDGDGKEAAEEKGQDQTSVATKVSAKLKSLSRKIYRADKPIKHLGMGYYRGGSSMEARAGVDITVKDGMVQPGKGLSINQNPEDKFIVQYGGAHAVMSIPDTLVIVQKGRPGHYEICAKAPMPVAAYQAALNSIPLQKWENK